MNLQRRQLLKLLLPLGLVGAGLVAGRLALSNKSCQPVTPGRLLVGLQSFVDMRLGGSISANIPAEWASRFYGVCESDLAEHFRKEVREDYVAGKTLVVDGWLLSETEAFTHRAAFLANGRPIAD